MLRLRVVTAALLAAVALSSCSNGSAPETATTTLPATTTTETTTTTTEATTTTIEVLDEAAGVWCDLHPWPFLQAADSLGLISQTELDQIEIDGTAGFWSSDGIDLFTGKPKFATLPTDWYEYPGAEKALQASVAQYRDRVGEEKYAHACNIAFETR